MKIIKLESNDSENTNKLKKILSDKNIQCEVMDLEHLIEMENIIAEKKYEFKLSQLENQISELEDLYQQLAKRVRGFIKYDIASGKITIIDRFLAEMSGYSLEKWQNSANFIQRIIHPDFENYYSSCLDELHRGIVPKVMEYKIISEGGEERWWIQFNIGAFDIEGRLVSISAVIIDNTENKKTEIKYRNLFENLNAGVFRVNIDTGEFLDANQMLVNSAGYSDINEFKKNCNAKDFYFNIEDRNKIIHLLKTEGKVTNYEVKLRCKDGSFNWSSHSASDYPKEGYCEGIIIDISDMKRANKEIKESEEKFRSLVEQSVAGIIIVKDNKIIFSNDIISKQTGYESKQLLMTDLNKICNIIHPDDCAQVLDQFQKVDENGIVPEFYFRVYTSDNRIIWLSAQLKKFSYEDGSAISCIMVEVTKRIELEQKLLLERNLAQSYFDIAGVLLIVLDKNADVIQINKRGCEILRCTKEDVIGKNWIQSFLPEKIRSNVQRTFNKCFAGSISKDDCFENYILTKDGEERLISWHNAVLYDSEGNINAVISSGEDITLPRIAEKILGTTDLENNSKNDDQH